MKIHLPNQWKNRLAVLPETSMGAQHVDILLSDGQMLEDISVFNGEDCEVSTPFNPKKIRDIRLHQPLSH